MVMGRNGYGPILSWAEMVMGRNDQLPSVLIRMRQYLGCAVIYEKNMELQMQKVRRPFNILILYISLFDFFSLDFPKNDFLSGVFLQCFHNV